MTDLPQLLADRLAAAFADVAGEPTDPAVRRSDHADYQADGALPLAKKLRRNPREVAAEILERVDLTGLVANVEIAGPGFLNVTVHDTALSALVAEVANDERLGVAYDDQPRRVVVDYSAPNVAKEMHVGHLRSTIIGDAFVRILEHLGHDVIRRNHIGDWGTQFGMIIEHLVDLGADANAGELSVKDLGGLYKQANEKFKADDDFKERSRLRVVKLQGGDEETLALWRILVAESERYFRQVYDLLDVRLTPEDNVGESAYNDELASVVDELTELGLAVESDGALCVFPDGFTGRDGKPFPLILRKRDGGYNYDTTDLAAIRNRVRDLKADRLVYITDLGQQQHFHLIFQAAKQAGWLGETTAEFDGHGIVLGPDRKRLRTREGNTPKLVDLLDEAVRRAAVVVAEKSPHLPAEEQQVVAKAVGIGALKYADLSNDRVKDYVFDWDRMLAMEGNTGVYLQYAHARTKSILRRGEIDPSTLQGVPVHLADPAEHALALRLLEFQGALRRAIEGVGIHRVCGYLFDLASAFTAFYDKCPVLKAPDEQTKLSRLVLCDVTGRTLAAGLGVLGISAPDRM